ncbi:MAG: hypothetical protein COB36_11605 [Alphaproteobacteria bacterium]|nr:MAG: hypothetical protein COB36_11605 [Alphaproteobacteria bacterium]
MDLQLSVEAYDRSTTGGALEILQNMYSEQQPETDGRGHTLLSGPGITAYRNGYLGGNVRGFLAKDGLFDGDIFSVHGTNVYRTDSAGVQTLLGSVPASGLVTIAASRNEVLVCVDPGLYSYNGVDFIPVVLPGFGVSSIAYIAQRFVGSSNSIDRWYWSDLLDGRTWDGLNFKTAEGEADKAVRVYTTPQYVVVFGTESTEVYGLNANPRTPADTFYRISTGAMAHGLLAPLSVAKEGAFIFWLSNKKNIFVASGFRPNKISTPYEQDLLDSLTDAELAGALGYSYTQRGHTFFVFTVPNKFTLTYDLGNQKWQIRKTLGGLSWRAELGIKAFGKVIAANTNSADLFEIDLDAKTDLGVPIVQEFTVSIPVRAPLVLEDLTIDMWSDTAGFMAMKFTQTGGRGAWTSFVDARMSAPSYEDTQVMWRDLGTARAPERIQRFRISDPANVMVRGARANDGID